MQDQDVHPVEEGEIGGGAVVVPEADLRRTGVISIAGFIPHPWTTVIARRWVAETMARAPVGRGRASLRGIRNPNPSPCRFVKTQLPASLVSSTTCSSRPRFRRPRAS